MSQRLALKYNTTPRGACQHFLTSFFQFLCGGWDYPFRHRLRRCHTPPFVTYGDIFPRSGGSRPSRGRPQQRRQSFRHSPKASPWGSWRAAPEKVQPYIITLYRQCETQTGIDCGLYYPPESVLRCQEFPCKILSRKISAIFGDCYKTQNIVVFRLTCH